MRKSRFSTAIGLSVAGVLALSACASSDNTNNSSSAGGDSGSAGSTSVSLAITNVFSSLNSATATGNSDTNGMIARTTNRGFYSVTNEFEIRHNDWFGTFGMTEEGEGIKVDYKVNDDQKWSDGNDIDKGDLMLAWAAQSGYFDSEEEDGVTFFAYSGDTTGLKQAGKPTFGDDNRSISFNYPQPFADWEISYDIGVPAHVVAELAGMTEEELVETLETAEPGVENENLSKIAEAWNTGFDTTSMPSNELLTVGNGPYLVSAVEENQSITLTKNENYQGDTKPSIDEIVLKILPDASAQVQALKNGDVDVVTPQASIDTVQQLEGLSGVVTETTDDQSYDHLDLNMVEGGVFADENVRKAFLLTVPRQDIVDKLIKPMNDSAAVLNSQLFLTTSSKYASVVTENNSSEYPTDNMEENINKAKELLDGKTPTVRILYNNKNQNRVNTFQMIQESAQKAGFVVEDLGNENWSKMLSTGVEGAYDASIFGWVSSGVGYSSLGQLFSSGSSSNFTSYSNDKVDANAQAIMKTTDVAEIENLMAEADGEIFNDAFGLPLFQSIAVISYNENIKGIKQKPGQDPAIWNVEEWTM